MWRKPCFFVVWCEIILQNFILFQNILFAIRYVKIYQIYDYSNIMIRLCNIILDFTRQGHISIRTPALGEYLTKKNIYYVYCPIYCHLLSSDSWQPIFGSQNVTWTSVFSSKHIILNFFILFCYPAKFVSQK